MSSDKVSSRPPRDSRGAAHGQAQAQPRGEAASYFDRAQSFGSPSPKDQSGSSSRNTNHGHATLGHNSFGYTENAGEVGETYSGTTPPIFYQQTLPGSRPVSPATSGEHHTPISPQHAGFGDTAHGHAESPPAEVLAEGTHGLSHMTAPLEGSHVKPGMRGTIQGLIALARKKPHVRDDTPARLELLKRADRFFNEGFVGKHGRLSKEKTAQFRQEIERVEAKLGQL